MTTARVVGPRIDVTDAKAMVDAGNAIILDVVAAHIWPSMSRIIEGAIRISPEDVEERYKELPREQTIIAYCT